MIDMESTKEKFSFKNILKNLAFKSQFRRDNPHYFEADGLCCFTGPQGSGKTLSAVNYVYNLMKRFPNSKLVTNLYLTDFPIVSFEDYVLNNYPRVVLDAYNNSEIPEPKRIQLYNEYLTFNRVFEFVDNDDFQKYSNLNEGVIYLVDEIQLYLNSKDSKNIDMEVLVEISQQRKQRKHIVCTSQVFGRMAKPIREQFSTVCKCKCFFGMIQYNQYLRQEDIDMEDGALELAGKTFMKRCYIHSPLHYRRYDTYYKIKRGNFVGKMKGENQIYGESNQSSNRVNA